MERNTQRHLIRRARTDPVPRTAPSAPMEHHPVHGAGYGSLYLA